MPEPLITTDIVVADALQRIPHALEQFVAHGVDPTCDCGLMAHAVTLAEAERKCGLRDAAGLAAELNAVLEASEAWPLEGDAEPVGGSYATP
jgi:hypothetical protein